MDQVVKDYLLSHRVCVLAVPLPDGSPHAVVLHYCFEPSSLRFYFSTERTSKKCLSLVSGQTKKSSLALGVSEEDWITAQLDGEIRMLQAFDEIDTAKKYYYKSFPDSRKYEGDTETVYLEFIPLWCRYTDFNTNPITIHTFSR